MLVSSSFPRKSLWCLCPEHLCAYGGLPTAVRCAHFGWVGSWDTHLLASRLAGIAPFYSTPRWCLLGSLKLAWVFLSVWVIGFRSLNIWTMIPLEVQKLGLGLGVSILYQISPKYYIYTLNKIYKFRPIFISRKSLIKDSYQGIADLWIYLLLLTFSTSGTWVFWSLPLFCTVGFLSLF